MWVRGRLDAWMGLRCLLCVALRLDARGGLGRAGDISRIKRSFFTPSLALAPQGLC